MEAVSVGGAYNTLLDSNEGDLRKLAIWIKGNIFAHAGQSDYLLNLGNWPDIYLQKYKDCFGLLAILLDNIAGYTISEMLCNLRQIHFETSYKLS